MKHKNMYDENQKELKDAENLPGYKRKSFVLPYNGGEIWFEHLDGIYNHENLVLKKLESDIPLFSKPSSTSFICFVFDETEVTDRILAAVVNSILENTKSFMRVAFLGIDRKGKLKLKHELSEKSFAIGFFDGLEDAKEWLLP